MAELPPHLKAVQDQFRPRMEAQTARMQERHADELAAEIASAEPVDEMSAEDFLAEMDEEIGKH